MNCKECLLFVLCRNKLKKSLHEYIANRNIEYYHEGGIYYDITFVSRLYDCKYLKEMIRNKHKRYNPEEQLTNGEYGLYVREEFNLPTLDEIVAYKKEFPYDLQQNNFL